MTYIWDFMHKDAYNNRSGKYKTKVQLDFILTHMQNRTGKILDIAGGAGRFAIPLLAYSKDITVLDINETAIKILNERNKNIATICGDFIEKDINKTFSLILCIEALGYFKDWEHYFKKINSLLEQDGRFIFTYTNPSSWRFLLRNIKRKVSNTNTYTEMYLTKFKKLLHQCGLEIESMEGMNWMPLPVRSDSILVGPLAFLEKTFRLNKWYSQSPWLMISVKKIK
ncbi:MAG TPA: class I SAM-dependent methyltransferase [Bacteroidia bacterium]|jgi:2-polyprenyl-3-methyl-5-hydroxy-6-metoxy-1,4-benzoquinol methylase|nr:class I SAM-dependent methyltransferase [Bacteroidia bacterium]